MTETETAKPNYLQATIDGQIERTGWIGPWPPPEQMLVIVSTYSGLVWRPVEMDDRMRQVIKAGIERGWQVLLLTKLRHSAISDEDYTDMTHVLRGAEYEVAGPWSPYD